MGASYNLDITRPCDIYNLNPSFICGQAVIGVQIPARPLISMHHVAIMKKSWKLIDKIVSGGKTIESRWYKTRRAPFGKIKPEDIIYFKDSGEPVTARATVQNVLQFSDLNQATITKLLKKYGKRIGSEYVPGLAEQYADKKYCILIFLTNPKFITPFRIDKTGYGNPNAWLCVNDISKIKLKN